eukprot:TRINITY_DN6121_c0_g1_i6.p2 TRINITY_DN6121_c0_g1~~TRINITY_DN6121_c0_g1_i6.p2  ORF type:complete len:294 (+),score=17.58 TRINITY_DN6121_c0_g1_i6:2-883(+)
MYKCIARRHAPSLRVRSSSRNRAQGGATHRQHVTSVGIDNHLRNGNNLLIGHVCFVRLCLVPSRVRCCSGAHFGRAAPLVACLLALQPLQRNVMKKRGREEPCPICFHYHDYEGGERCRECGHQKSMAPKSNIASQLLQEDSLPHVIREKFLYLGSYHHAAADKTLNFVGITHLLCLSPEVKPLYPQTYTYFTLNDKPPPISECLQFLDGVKQSGGKVLVYDMSCRGAAPYIVIAYLVQDGWTLADALSEIYKLTACRVTEDMYQKLAQHENGKHGRVSMSWQEVQTLVAAQP